jgi:hypothetical protein
MKTIPRAFRPMLIGTAALSALLGTALLRAAEDSAGEAEQNPPLPQSVFVIPQPGMKLKDPFFPDSTRLANAKQPVVEVAPEATADDLALKAISGTAERPLAMINGHTFAVGEEREVRTAHGRIRVRLISVDGLKVTIAVGNQTRELRLRGYEPEPAEVSGSARPETVQINTSEAN